MCRNGLLADTDSEELPRAQWSLDRQDIPAQSHMAPHCTQHASKR